MPSESGLEMTDLLHLPHLAPPRGGAVGEICPTTTRPCKGWVVGQARQRTFENENLPHLERTML